MPVTFENVFRGETYSRPKLAKMWGYSGYQALARGIVTPKNDSKIILFITKEKQSFQEQYEDELIGDLLKMEGPTDHFGEERMIYASDMDDEIHLFYRDRHHTDFTYEGEFVVTDYQLRSEQPSKFTLERQK